MWIAYIVSAVLAAGLSSIELLSGLKTRPTLREGAWMWWLVRLLLEGGAGALAVFLLKKATHNSWNPLLLALAAGGSTSAVLRLRFTTLGDGTPLGVALAYNYFRDFFDDQIERCGSENDSKWINDEILPVLYEASSVTSAQIGKRLVDFVAGLGHMDDAQRLDEQAAIEKIVKENGTDEKVKIEGVIAIGRRLKAFKTIQNICDGAKKEIDSSTAKLSIPTS